MDLLELGRQCIWCKHKQCWVHKQICGWKAFSLGEKRCCRCLQMALWPGEKSVERACVKHMARKRLSTPEESAGARGPRQLSLFWSVGNQSGQK